MGIKKILLVEDDPNFGIVLKDYLALNDYHVTHAKDGIEGLIMFKNNDFDLCILDVMMPRKDGFTLAKDIRSTNKEIPIVFLTAKTMKEDVMQKTTPPPDRGLRLKSQCNNTLPHMRRT